MRQRSPKQRFLLLSLAVLALDQWSKWMVELHLPHHAIEPVLPGLLNLSHVRNTGVAFGMFASGSAESSPLLTFLALLALTGVAVYFHALPSSHRLGLAALALVLGGAVGNLLDRLVAGAVTDFVDLHLGGAHFPSFNVADSAITTGICLMLLDTAISWRRGHGSAAADHGA